jgi:hypothetical protein
MSVDALSREAGKAAEAAGTDAEKTRAAILAHLDELPDDALVQVELGAALYGASVRGFWRMADRGDVPRPNPVGRLRRWRLGDLRNHIRAGCPRVRDGRKGGAACP